MGFPDCERRKTTIFCKLIEEFVINDRKLIIPETFVKKYGNELCATVILRVIKGDLWKIGVEKLHKKLWFSHGWSQFVYHHSIHAGSFLVFVYHGDSIFDVYVCDLKARESSYLSCLKVYQHGNQSLVTPTDVENDEVAENLSSSSSPSLAAFEALAAGGRNSDPQLNFGISKTNRRYDPVEDRVVLNPSCSMSIQRGNVRVGVESDTKGLKRSRTEVSYSQGFNSNKTRAVRSPGIKNLRIFYSSRPAAPVTGNKEKLSQNEIMSISGSADLRSAQTDGRNYSSSEAINPNLPRDEEKKSVGSIRFCGLIQDLEIAENGQKEVVRPSNQHIEEENIYNKERTRRSVSKRWRVATTRQKERALLAAKMYVPSFAYYQIVLQPSYVYKGTLRLSNEFANTFLNGASEFIFLEISSGKRWRTRCILGDGYAKLSSGWSEFVRENQLMEGDVCVFEVINMKDVVLKVSIFRALEDV